MPSESKIYWFRALCKVGFFLQQHAQNRNQSFKSSKFLENLLIIGSSINIQEINIEMPSESKIYQFVQGLSIERVKKLHIDFTDNQQYLQANTATGPPGRVYV